MLIRTKCFLKEMLPFADFTLGRIQYSLNCSNEFSVPMFAYIISVHKEI